MGSSTDQSEQRINNLGDVKMIKWAVQTEKQGNQAPPPSKAMGNNRSGAPMSPQYRAILQNIFSQSGGAGGFMLLDGIIADWKEHSLIQRGNGPVALLSMRGLSGSFRLG